MKDSIVKAIRDRNNNGNSFDILYGLASAGVDYGMLMDMIRCKEE